MVNSIRRMPCPTARELAEREAADRSGPGGRSRPLLRCLRSRCLPVSTRREGCEEPGEIAAQHRAHIAALLNQNGGEVGAGNAARHRRETVARHLENAERVVLRGIEA